MIFYQGLIDSCLSLGKTILPTIRKYQQPDLSRVLNLIALCHSFRAEYDKALQFHLESLTLRRQAGDLGQVAISLNNIGLLFYKLKNYHKAVRYFRESLKLKNQANDTWDMEFLKINIGLTHANLGNLDSAQYFTTAALEVCEPDCSTPVKMHSEFSRGLIAFIAKNNKQAEKHFLNSYDLAGALQDERMQMANIDYLSDIYTGEKMTRTAIEFLCRAENLTRNIEIHCTPEILKIYKHLYQAFSKEQDFTNMARYQAKYIALKDSVYNEELTINLMKIQSNYLERENEARLASNARVLSLNGKIIRYQRTLAICVIGFAILLIVVTAVLIRTNRREKTLNRTLDKKILERTRILEERGGMARKLVIERRLAVTRSMRRIKALLATIEGLCRVALSDVISNDHRDRLTKIKSTTIMLSSTLTPVVHDESVDTPSG